MILSDEEEESATLAEPMTLECAKQLAQSSGSTSTPPLPVNLASPLSHPLHVTSPPSPHLASPTPPPTLNHLSPLSAHHLPHVHSSRSILYPLASPPPHSPGGHLHHLTSPSHSLTSPTPPHFPSPTSHIHSLHSNPLWVTSPQVVQEESEEEKDLPSTVDIQAIRDSPSPDNNSGKLMTINENWDSIDDIQNTVTETAMGDGEDSGNDCDEDDDDEEEEEYISDTDSNHSQGSLKSVSFDSHPQQSTCHKKQSDVHSPSGSRSSSVSCGSKSETDSQDSDSDSSECSSSEGESKSSCSSEGEEENQPGLKPLPRRKPQLTASNLNTSQSYANRGNGSSLIAKGKLSDVNPIPQFNKSEFVKETVVKENKIQHDSKKKNENISPSKTRKEGELHDSKVLHKNEMKSVVHKLSSLNTLDAKLKDNSPHNVSSQHKSSSNKTHSEVAENLVSVKFKSKTESENDHIANKLESQEKIKSSMEELSLNDLNLKNNHKNATERKFTCDFSDSGSEDSPLILSAEELEKRRLEKKLQLDKEFDRLLQSTNTSKTKESRPSDLSNSCNETSRKGDSLTLEKSNENEGLSKENKSKSNVECNEKSKATIDISSSSKKSQNSHSLKVTKESHNLKVTKESFPEVRSDKMKKQMGKISSTENLSEESKQVELHENSSKIRNKSECRKETRKSHSSKSQSYVSTSNNEDANISKPKTSKHSKTGSRQLSPIKSNSNVVGKDTKTSCSPTKVSPKSESHHHNWIHPTIADTVKVRERTKSFDKESSQSGSEKEKEKYSKKKSSNRQKKKHSRQVDENTSSEENSDELNEKVDVDTEQTQTFSLSGSNFDQGRLSLKIAAMKMAKFGKTGLREVTTGVLPTRSDSHTVLPAGNRSGSTFKRPVFGSLKTSGTEGKDPPKVKTAAERKTYSDGLPVCGGSLCPSSLSRLRIRQKKGIKGRANMRILASSLCRSGGLCGSIHNHSGVCPPNSQQSTTHSDKCHVEDDEISKIAQSLSQISNDQLSHGIHEQLGHGLQVLDQEDLAAILPDVNGTGLQQDASTPVSLDSFPDDVEFPTAAHASDTDLDTSSADTSQDGENILSMVMLSGDNIPQPLNNTCEDNTEQKSQSGKHVSSGNVNSSEGSGLRRVVHTRNARNCQNGPSSKLKEAASTKKSKEQEVELQISKEEDEENNQLPELESYVSLDCNASNVSPDSGIQSVNGSPLHPVGSPNRHSPFYSSLATPSSACGVNSSSENLSDSVKGCLTESCASNQLRPYSPSLSCQDSPPPPTLLPAVTPPHLASSPRYNYEDGASSPPMPSLKCQIDPPPWKESVSFEQPNEEPVQNDEKCHVVSSEVAEDNPPEINNKDQSVQKECDTEKTKPKRQRGRGRPKGSRNKPKEVDNDEEETDKKTSFIKETSVAKLGKAPNSSESDVPDIDYSAMKHSWRGPITDSEEILFKTSQKTSRRKPGRPKKIECLAPEKVSSEPSENQKTSKVKSKIKISAKKDQIESKRPVGRPRKYPKSEVVSDISRSSPTPSEKKCPSERLMHKVVNEKIKNSEKSDKLSIQSTETEENDPVEGAGNVENKDLPQPVSRSTSADRAKEKKKSKTSEAVSMIEDKKKKRGRKKQLPAIFKKVYGSKNSNAKSESSKPTAVTNVVSFNAITLSHKKKKKKKRHKSKHKNIVDPVFLAELDALISDLQKCFISKSGLPLLKSGELPLPTIFRFRPAVLTTKKRRHPDKPKNSDKESGTEGEGNKEKLSSKRKKKLQEVPKQGKDRSDPNEQRLPLKKRHRHISTAVPLSSPEINVTNTDNKYNNSNDAISSVRKVVDCEKVYNQSNDKVNSKVLIDSTKAAKIESKSPKSNLENKSIQKLNQSPDFKNKSKPSDSYNEAFISTSHSPKNSCQNGNGILSNVIENQVNNVLNNTTLNTEHSESVSTLDPSERKSDKIIENKIPLNSFDNSETKLSVVNRATNKEVIKKDCSLYLPTTTPKKRHRLEVELASSDSNVTTVNASTMSCVVTNTNSITTQLSTIPVVSPGSPKITIDSSKIKQERDVKEKDLRSKTPKSSNNTATDIQSHKKPKRQDVNETLVKKDELPMVRIKGEIVPIEEHKECENTHSDSDIPSEHEPLYESDQSGFMSDKEAVKVPVKKNVKKVVRKKQKKQNNKAKTSSIKKSKKSPENGEPPIEITKSVLKKKRRKTNKTGFPTIRKKKKKVIEEPEKVKESQDLKNPSIVLTPLESTSVKDSDNVQESKVAPSTSRGRSRKPLAKPRRAHRVCKNLKDEVSQSETNENETDQDIPKKLTELSFQDVFEKVVKGVCYRTRNKRDLSEESAKIVTGIKRPRKLSEEEVEDSDATLPSSDGPICSDVASSDECSKASVTPVPKKVPRWRRKFIVAGLFSDYYKQDEPTRKNGDVVPRNKIAYDPDGARHKLLPPPCYCRKWLRERSIDFKLPYDLWWLHTNKMLPGRDVIPSWNYRKVKTNVYYDVKPHNSFETQACNCKRPTKPSEIGCGDDCINRMMFIECLPSMCPIADTCSNQRIQRHEIRTQLKRFMTDQKGWGIKSTESFKAGTFILEYVGEVVSEKEFKHRMHTKYVNDTHHYCLNLDRGMVIDGHRIGGDCRFVNHSCEPNCEMQKWYVNGQYRMALFALKDIKENEELTYDYNFSLFNPAQGQPCKCGSSHCRGVIGGKSQRVNGLVPLDQRRSCGRNKREVCRKRKRGTSTDTESGQLQRSQILSSKPLSHQQRLYILAHRCFLLRNLEKVRRGRECLSKDSDSKKTELESELVDEPCNKIEKFLTHFTALNTARSVKTRRLAQAEDDPEMTRVAKLAQIFKDIYDKLVASRDEKDVPLATPFVTLPSKKKSAVYYTRVGEPIDLSTIEKNIMTGHYITVESFDEDIMKLFANNLRFYGRNTDIGRMAVGLRKVYSECKLQFKPFLEEVLGEDQLPPAFANCSLNEEFEDEDVIRCVCNLCRDEGMMIQCERCLVWQHCDCMGVAEDSPDRYMCEECSPRLVSPEVPMTPQPTDIPKDHKHFITLLRDNLQIKQGDSVYILRDRPTQKPAERRLPAYKLCKDIKPHELLIFKVENLWIDGNGDKFAFGHHYLRPHETFHEPWRKFFPNEVIRSPHCEIIPLDMIVNHCWVLDLNTYCRGRPIVAVEDHVYICEYRVDKIARVFYKISKPKYPVCTKPYAFITFSTKLKPQRTYTPHEVIVNGRSRNRTNEKSDRVSSSSPASIKEEPAPVDLDQAPGPSDSTSSKIEIATIPETRTRSSRAAEVASTRNESRSQERIASTKTTEEPITKKKGGAPPTNKLSVREEKRLRANNVASRLLRRLPTKGAVDLSFLLDCGKRQRKKPAAFGS